MVHTKSRSRPGLIREQRGFTAIELMVVVAILGILAALAAPSFNSLIQNWRMRQITDDLASTFMLARTEAIRRGGNVVVRRVTPNSTDCPGVDMATDQWGCGWFVFVDLDDDNALDANETELRVSHAPRSIRVKRTTTATFFRLNQWGEAAGIGALGFVISPLNSTTGPYTALCVSSGGRLDIRKGADACTS